MTHFGKVLDRRRGDVFDRSAGWSGDCDQVAPHSSFPGTGPVPAPGAGKLLVRDPAEGQCRAGATDRPPAETSRGPPLEAAEGLLPQLPVSGEVVGPRPAGGGEGRVARGGVVPSGGVRGDQPETPP